MFDELDEDALARFQALAEKAVPVPDDERRDIEGKLSRTDNASLDRVMIGDRKFFKRRPWRKYRLRRAAQVEIKQSEIVTGSQWKPLPGMARFVVVQQITPGLRARMHVELPDTIDEGSEKMCEALWNGPPQ